MPSSCLGDLMSKLDKVSVVGGDSKEDRTTAEVAVDIVAAMKKEEGDGATEVAAKGSLTTNAPSFAPRVNLAFRSIRHGVCFTGHEYLSNFSITIDGTTSFDRTPKYLHLPQRFQDLGINLNGGFDRSRLFDERLPFRFVREKKKRAFYEWLTNSKILTPAENDLSSNVFVAPDDILSTLMITPYDAKFTWKLLATKYNGAIFLNIYKKQNEDYVIVSHSDNRSNWRQQPSESKSPVLPQRRNGHHASSGQTHEKQQAREKQTMEQRTSAQLQYHRPKLVDLLTSEDKFEVAGLMSRKAERSFNEREINFSVFKCAFAGDTIISMAQIDCCDPQCPQSKAVDIKISKTMRSANDIATFHKEKQLVWWSRAVVPGIETVVFGNRSIRRVYDRSGGFTGELDAVLNEVRVMATRDIPRSCRSYWSETCCLNFLNRVLNVVKEAMSSAPNDPTEVLEFCYDRSCDKIRTLKSYLSEDVFLPNWFYEL